MQLSCIASVSKNQITDNSSILQNLFMGSIRFMKGRNRNLHTTLHPACGDRPLLVPCRWLQNCSHDTFFVSSENIAHRDSKWICFANQATLATGLTLDWTPQAKFFTKLFPIIGNRLIAEYNFKIVLNHPWRWFLDASRIH